MGAGRVMSLLGGAALIGAILFRIPTAAPPDSGNLSAASGVDRNRVAVLPLQNLSPSADDAFIADGLTAELTTRLSRLRGLGVIPTISVSRPGRTERPPVEIGRELGVGTLIEGSVRKIESSVRMTVQLQDVATEEIVWAGSFDADVSQLLDMQRRVAEEVALQLKLSNISGNGLVDDPFGADSKAYESYLRARAALTRDDWTGVLEARDYFRQSVGHDSTFAGAWSGLAHATNELIRNGLLTGSGSWEAARRAAERALAHDAELPEAHAALAVVHAMADWSFVSAERHFQRALELDPSDVATRLDYAVLLRNDGRFDEALEQIHRARTLDPAMPQAALEEANLHYLAGRADHAVRLLEGLLGAFHGEGDRDGTGADRERFRIPPFWPHFTLALARAELGEYEAALESLDAGDPVGARPDTRAFRAYVLAEMGQPEAARKILDGASVDPGSAPMTEFHEAIVHVALGEHDRALDLLEAAARERSRLLRLLKVEPKLAPLRSHARYQALLVDLGLAGGGEVVAARSQGRGEDGVAPIPVAARGEARSPAGPH